MSRLLALGSPSVLRLWPAQTVEEGPSIEELKERESNEYKHAFRMPGKQDACEKQTQRCVTADGKAFPARVGIPTGIDCVPRRALDMYVKTGPAGKMMCDHEKLAKPRTVWTVFL